MNVIRKKKEENKVRQEQISISSERVQIKITSIPTVRKVRKKQERSKMRRDTI